MQLARALVTPKDTRLVIRAIPRRVPKKESRPSPHKGAGTESSSSPSPSKWSSRHEGSRSERRARRFDQVSRSLGLLRGAKQCSLRCDDDSSGRHFVRLPVSGTGSLPDCKPPSLRSVFCRCRTTDDLTPCTSHPIAGGLFARSPKRADRNKPFPGETVAPVRRSCGSIYLRPHHKRA